MFEAINIAASGMSANKMFIEVTSNNIANIQTTRTDNGGPYQRQAVTFEERKDFKNIMESYTGKGVEVGNVLQDDNIKYVYDPAHPDATEEGYVLYPEINMTAEMTNLLVGQRGYESSVTAFNNAKSLLEKTMQIGR